jgi:MYXO-CTERM domain-containing protein
MNYARRSGSRLTRLTLVALALAGRPAVAQVIEPNGISVPGPTPDPVSLQQYFSSPAVNENINVVAQAAITPATFMPLCDFQATLVLDQSNADAGLGWYNVPASPTAVPTTYLIGTSAIMLGQTITSADIRNDPNYAGGLVGFALERNNGNGTPYAPVYYSEDTRNVYCSGCNMPGYWKMMLSYQSTVSSNEYYLAWEDWPGADANSWQGNDGDFNDKVFAITGVTCDGGGVPCQTNLHGVCANGITQCVVGGSPTCTQEVMPSAEKCDNLDNDCDGMVDDGDNLCPTGQTCVQGKCVGPCSDTEFPCGPPLVCVNGLCVDQACETVTCPVGQICQNGTCTGGCDGVVCPANQICELGVCVDPCAGVTCKGTVCKLGVCIQSCSCAPCPSGQVCAASGACVDTGCETMTCGAGQVCSKGSCVDSCAGAKCPGGATCSMGQCGQPVSPPATGQGGSTGAGGTTGAGGMIVTTTTGAGGKGGSGGASGAGGTIPSGSGGSVPGSGGSPSQEGGVVSCACTTGGGGASHLALAVLLAFASAMLARRRRARR